MQIDAFAALESCMYGRKVTDQRDIQHLADPDRLAAKQLS